MSKQIVRFNFHKQMLLLLQTANVVSKLVNITAIETTENQYFIPDSIANCYGRNNILAINVDLGMMCIEFDVKFNEECMQFPPGIYLDIQLTNFPEYVIRGQIKTFSYKNDKSLCYQCPVIGNDTNCLFIQKTDAAQVTIKSLIRQTQLPIGQIQIAHSSQSECYDKTQSQMFIRQTQAKLRLYKSFLCPIVLKYDSYVLRMIELDGNIDEIKINEFSENGTQQVIFTSFDEYIEVALLVDFTNSYTKFYGLVDFELDYIIGGITTTRVTQIYLVQSLKLTQMYINPVFTVWASRFQLIADPLPDAQKQEDDYGIKSTKIRIRYEVFNSETGQTIGNLFFDTPSFTFLNIDETLVCDDNLDEGQCSNLLSLLQIYDLTKVEILMHYHFYDETGKIILYASNEVKNIRNTCWTGVEGIYLQDRMCGKFTKNVMATTCPYDNTTSILFSIDFDDYTMNQRINYSVNDEQVCVECQDSTCIKKIAQLFKSKSSVTFTFKSGEESYQLVSVNNFNDNYTKLHGRMFLCAIAIVLILITLVLYYILRFKGIIIGIKKDKKKVQIDNDELV